MTYKILNTKVISENNEDILLTGKNFSLNAISTSVVNLRPNFTSLNCSESNYFIGSVTGASKWTAFNVPKDCLYMLVLQLNNGGLGTQTWFNNTKWGEGISPTLTINGSDILVFLTDDGGLTWYGMLNSKNII